MSRKLLGVAGFCALLMAFLLMVSPAFANTTERVSVSSAGDQANAEGGYYDYGATSISADGRYVAFESYASNLAPGDVPNTCDVFVRDRLTNTTTLVSQSTAGSSGNNLSGRPSISADGRFVVFDSFATNLVAGPNVGQQVYVRDMVAQTTLRVSDGAGGASPNGWSWGPKITPDGSRVAYRSNAGNLISGDTNNTTDVFVTTLVGGIPAATTIVSVRSDGGQGSDPSPWNSADGIDISADGRYVVFASQSSLVAGVGAFNVYVRDTWTNTTSLVSASVSGGGGDDTSWRPSISADGRYIAFISHATNLVPSPPPYAGYVYIRDTVAGTTTLVDSPPGDMPAISADGRWVAYVAGGSGPLMNQVLVRDRSGGGLQTASVNSGDVLGNNQSLGPAISADGRYVAFKSAATNLVPNDTNGFKDAFVHEMGATMWDISASSGPNGSVTPPGVTSVVQGSSQTYTIAPDMGYHVVDVLVDGAPQGQITTYTFPNVTASHTISATFAIDTFTITTAPSANGTITASPTVNYGSNRSFLIQADAGYHISSVVVDGVGQGVIGSYTFYNVTSAGHTISATFAADTFTITASAVNGGSISPSGPTAVSLGGSQTYTIEAAAGYHVTDVLVDGVSEGPITSYTFPNVTAGHTISATFAADALPPEPPQPAVNTPASSPASLTFLVLLGGALVVGFVRRVPQV